MNGAELTQLLKSAPLLADTPVILMIDDDESRGYATSAFVSKPFGPDRRGPARGGSVRLCEPVGERRDRAYQPDLRVRGHVPAASGRSGWWERRSRRTTS